jgi:hypothetical protein
MSLPIKSTPELFILTIKLIPDTVKLILKTKRMCLTVTYYLLHVLNEVLSMFNVFFKIFMQKCWKPVQILSIFYVHNDNKLDKKPSKPTRKTTSPGWLKDFYHYWKGVLIATYPYFLNLCIILVVSGFIGYESDFTQNPLFFMGFSFLKPFSPNN